MLEEFKLAKDCMVFGNLIEAGRLANRIEIAEIDNKYLQFNAFYGWQLYIDLANNSESDVIEQLKILKIVDSDTRAINGKKIYRLDSEEKHGVIRYFQSVISCYIFSFTALEAYINFRLDSINPTIDDFANCEALSKFRPYLKISIPIKNIIREANIEDKLFMILPFFSKKLNVDLCGIENYKANFNRVNYVRNELIHLKRGANRTGQAQSGKFKTVKLWNLLAPKMEQDAFLFPLNPNSLIKSIIESIETSYSKE